MKKINLIILVFLTLIVIYGCEAEKNDNTTDEVIIKVTVTFFIDDETDPPQPVTVDYGSTLGELLPVAEKEKMVFLGWFTEEEIEFTAATAVVSDITIYAHFGDDPNRILIGIEIGTPIGELLMGNFTGDVRDYSNYIIRNVYDNETKTVTNNYSAVIVSGNTLIAGNSVTVKFTSLENPEFDAQISTTVSKTLAKTGIPVIYIDTQNEAAITSRVDYVYTNIKIVSEDPPYYLENKNFMDQIRGRGNSTWNYEKKPFRIRFNARTPLFGLTAQRNWILLALAKDYTMLSGCLPYELGNRFDMEFVRHFFHVDVVLNDRYQGHYVILEHNQVNPGRLDIDPYSGYLVEFDTNQKADPNPFFRTATTNLPTYISSPEGPPSGMDVSYEWVRDSINEFDRLLNSPVANFPFNNLKTLIDIDNFVDYFIVCEMTRNEELKHPKSIYMYKDAGKKIKMGPIWDFDWSMGLYERRTVDIPATGTGMNSPRGSITRNATSLGNTNRFARLNRDQEYINKFKTRWNEKYQDILSMTDYIEEVYEKINVSVSLDMVRWPNPAPTGGLGGPTARLPYRQEVDKLKQWWSQRAAWLNADIPTWTIHQ